MGDGYRIEEQALHGVLGALDRGGAALSDARTVLHDAPATELGGAELDAVAGELVARWVGAVDSVRDAVSDTANGVRGALSGYADTERWIASLFDEDGS
ncbi:MAG TPA: hypothetical protein VGN81_42125 [Pseudonocardiaceae bacterium]|jgi:hypothetical protein